VLGLDSRGWLRLRRSTPADSIMQTSAAEKALIFAITHHLPNDPAK
jgi:hypothetical protein